MDSSDKIINLLKIQAQLPVVGGHGGDYEVLDWLIDNALNHTFAFLFGALLAYGKKIGQYIISKRKIRRKISLFISGERKTISDVIMEDIINHFNVPKDFKGSKEQLIEKIIFERALNYKNELVEKIRMKK